jgi:hypothetical protein
MRNTSARKGNRIGTAHVTRAGMRLLAKHPTGSVWRVFAATVQYMDGHLQMAPGHRQIAEDTGKALRTVRLAFRYLVGAGVLSIVHRGNQYRAARYGIGPALRVRLVYSGDVSAAAVWGATADGGAAATQDATARTCAAAME